jgi:WD40 repeat protein
VLARGTSLLWLRAEPAPADRPPDEWDVDFDDDIRIVRTGDSLRTEERATGRTLGELTGLPGVAFWRDPTRPNASVSFLDGSVWVGRVAGNGWDVTRHELPTLRRTGAILLPSRDGGTPPADRGSPPGLAMGLEPERDGGRLFAIADGVLSMWDPDSAQPLGPPIHLGATNAEVGFHRRAPHMEQRPGHRGQVAVPGIDDVQIWDVPAGRLVTTIPAAALPDPLDGGESPITFDPTGDRLAVLGRDRTVQLWDIASARPVRPPIPAPTTQGLLGFDADGYLVAAQAGIIAAPAGLAFIDLDTGAEAGTADVTDTLGYLEIVAVSDDRRTLRLGGLGDERIFYLPVTAQSWRDGLCAAIGRELTAGEKRILPPGANADSPCS